MYCIINYGYYSVLSFSGLITGSLYLLIPFNYISSYFLKKVVFAISSLAESFLFPFQIFCSNFLPRPRLFPLHPFHILSFHMLLDNWNSSIVLFRSFWLLPLFDSRLLVYILLCFPCGSAGKESACSAADLGLISGLGRYSGEGKGYPL